MSDPELSPGDELKIRQLLEQFEQLRFSPDIVLLVAGLLLKDSDDYEVAVERAFKLREVFALTAPKSIFYAFSTISLRKRVRLATPPLCDLYSGD